MTSFYRFPAISIIDELYTEEQLNYIQCEVKEAIEAFAEYEMADGVPGSVQRVMGTDVANRRIDYGMELMDIIHVTETALRMMFTDDEIEELQRRVIEKNRKRGYYDE